MEIDSVQDAENSHCSLCLLGPGDLGVVPAAQPDAEPAAARCWEQQLRQCAFSCCLAGTNPASCMGTSCQQPTILTCMLVGRGCTDGDQRRSCGQRDPFCTGTGGEPGPGCDQPDTRHR